MSNGNNDSDGILDEEVSNNCDIDVILDNEISNGNDYGDGNLDEEMNNNDDIVLSSMIR